MHIAVLSGFALALAAPALYRRWPRAAAGLFALYPLALTLYFAGLAPAILAGGTRRSSIPWVPTLGVSLSCYLDGLGLLFALLISGIGALVVIYAGAYMADRPQAGRFHAFLLAFMASMLGLVLADNVIVLFAFWELTSLWSFLLIGSEHESAEARRSALMALLVTSGGGLALLAGLLLLSGAGGSLELSEIARQGDAVRAHPRHLALLALLLAGAFTKSAQVPFHFWLPSAMVAPTPVSAYLHSATMVKAGVYLLGRLHPVLGGTGAWLAAVSGVGAATMLTGALLALRQTDLKLILAYSTVSVLGVLTLLLGLGAPLAAMAYLLAHALYKGALFLAAGAIEHEAGTRDVTRLGGLLGVMPKTALATALACLSMAGLPLFLGYLAKDLLYEATLATGRFGVPLTALALLASALLSAVAVTLAWRPLLGRMAAPVRHEAPARLWSGPLLLAVLGLLLGTLPAVTGALLAPAAAAISGREAAVRLALWHGPALLGLSAATLAAGLLIAARWAAARRLIDRLAPILDRGPARWYEWGLSGLYGLARWQTALLQSGGLRRYLITVILFAILLVGHRFLSTGGCPGRASSAGSMSWTCATTSGRSPAWWPSGRSRRCWRDRGWRRSPPWASPARAWRCSMCSSAPRTSP
jgi:multicomponent Na+:H+ antiporter subunit A